jgi:hypothetical protein
MIDSLIVVLQETNKHLLSISWALTGILILMFFIMIKFLFCINQKNRG